MYPWPSHLAHTSHHNPEPTLNPKSRPDTSPQKLPSIHPSIHPSIKQDKRIKHQAQKCRGKQQEHTSNSALLLGHEAMHLFEWKDSSRPTVAPHARPHTQVEENKAVLVVLVVAKSHIEGAVTVRDSEVALSAVLGYQISNHGLPKVVDENALGR